MRPYRYDRSPFSPRRALGNARALGLTILIAIALITVLGGCRNDQTETEFNGTVLKSAELSPQFNLTNQLGQSVTLQNMQGRVVVLTFLYTYCPDVCPIITTQLKDVHEQLDGEASGVEFVAISVDPERDTVEAARDYLERWKLGNEWQFLVGSREILAPIWESYYLDPYAEDLREETPTPEPRGAIDGLSAAIAEKYLVIHSAPVFLIDPNGRRRVVFTSPLDPAEIVQDIRTLLR